MFLKQSTAGQVVELGPFLDDADFKTAETGLTIANTDIKLRKAGGTTHASKNSGGATHIANGYYYATFDATDSNTVGPLDVHVNVSGALPVWLRLYVLEEAVYDALFGASAPGYVANAPVNVAQFGGVNLTSAAGIPEVKVASLANNAITASSINSDAITSAKIADGALTAAKFAAGAFDAVWSVATRSLTTFGTLVADVWGHATRILTAGTNIVLAKGTGVTGFNDLSAAQVNTEVDTALADYDPPTKTELDAGFAALNNLSQAQAQTAAAAALTAYDPPTKAELDAAVAPLATEANVDAVEAKVDDVPTVAEFNARTLVAADYGTSANQTTILARLGTWTGTGVNTVLGAFKALLSKVATAPSDIGGTFDPATDSTEAIRDRGDAAWVTGGAGSAPTVEEIVDGIFGATAADYNDPLTMGEKINDAGSAGDPWGTNLPGSYVAGQAGYIVGNNLDAQISDLLGQSPQSPSIDEDCGEVQVFDAGEKKPVKVQLTATSGTFTISSATVSLLDGTGEVVGTLEDVAATGFDAGGLTAPRAWFTLDTADPNGADPALATGTYELVFTIAGAGSDTLPRTHKISVIIQVV